ncbi:MAG: histidine phosphatase family protein [Nocardioidaceae bacterium]
MTAPRRIVVWRHGRTEWNATGRAQGQEDVPLDEVGLTQARYAARLVAGMFPDRIVASDLSRAAETAAELGRVTGLPVTHDVRWREMHMGARQGMTLEEARHAYPEQMAAWQAGDEGALGGGETYAEVADRFAEALDDEVAKLDGEQTLVVVSHGAAMRVGICQWLGFPHQTWNSFGGFSNCCWTVLVEDRRGWRIAEWNAGSLPEPVYSDDEQDDDPVG